MNLRNLNTKMLLICIWGGDDKVGKLFEVGYYTEERNNAPYVDLINAETGEKVLVKYDDTKIQDNTSEKIPEAAAPRNSSVFPVPALRCQRMPAHTVRIL